MLKNSIWYYDMYRSTDNNNIFKNLLFHHGLRVMLYFRIAQNSNNCIVKKFFEYKLFSLGHKHGIEIKTSTKIGKGFFMAHPYNITISPYSTIGDNCNIHKGATIGMSYGKNAGSPIIGNRVYIGLNASVIGGITIGDDVMISPNSFVNCDVPSNSIVIGNPCVIIPKDNPTKNYIRKLV